MEISPNGVFQESVCLCVCTCTRTSVYMCAFSLVVFQSGRKTDFERTATLELSFFFFFLTKSLTKVPARRGMMCSSRVSYPCRLSIGMQKNLVQQHWNKQTNSKALTYNIVIKVWPLKHLPKVLLLQQMKRWLRIIIQSCALIDLGY